MRSIKGLCLLCKIQKRALIDKKIGNACEISDKQAIITIAFIQFSLKLGKSGREIFFAFPI